MGPLHFWPGTNTPLAHEHFEQAPREFLDQREPAAPLLKAGDAVIYDEQTLRCESENRSTTPLPLLFVTFLSTCPEEETLRQAPFFCPPCMAASGCATSGLSEEEKTLLNVIFHSSRGLHKKGDRIIGEACASNILFLEDLPERPEVAQPEAAMQGTNTPLAHEHFEQAPREFLDQREPAAPLLKAGDAVIYDEQTLRCESENRSTTPLPLLFVTFLSTCPEEETLRQAPFFCPPCMAASGCATSGLSEEEKTLLNVIFHSSRGLHKKGDRIIGEACASNILFLEDLPERTEPIQFRAPRYCTRQATTDISSYNIKNKNKGGKELGASQRSFGRSGEVEEPSMKPKKEFDTRKCSRDTSIDPKFRT
ncbi:hypothetical protein AK812_SmicGene7994 [Symbiodinium microadriaticum]|uniref:Uncharacterized protein n=1 Tax=Symbiodinium microadriaticum TaxID=2951 RepID=A0A1Q9EM28_SYMMI|nr:hypothetical protein AK812_SmicGene7994 [Symbiodinium microadriaticum]